jgi:hypothetical protein
VQTDDHLDRQDEAVHEPSLRTGGVLSLRREALELVPSLFKSDHTRFPE